MQKQPSRGVLRKRCSENMQQIYRRTPMPKCDFNKVALKLQSNCIKIVLRHEWSPVNLLHIFRNLFLGTPLGGCFWTLDLIFRCRYILSGVAKPLKMRQDLNWILNIYVRKIAFKPPILRLFLRVCYIRA